jgi:hypothetical protein
MAWKQHVLVVANVTASSQELLDVLRERAASSPTAIHFVIPATPLEQGRESPARRLEHAVAQLRGEGLEADGVVGNADPFVAVTDVWNPMVYDEIIISTLPIGVSRWLHAGLPERIGRATGALVTHVVSQPPGHALQPSPAPQHEERGILSPLYVLGWGRGKRA